MAQDVWMVTPRTPEPINDNLIGRDEVPKPPTSRDLGKLSSFLTTPMGVAYFAWAKQGPKWDVVDMNNEHVYAAGIGADQIWYVPARWNGLSGVGGRYYWVPVTFSLDRTAMAAADALQIQQDAANAKALADARAAAMGQSGGTSKFGGVPGGMAGGMTGFRASKELGLYDGPMNRIWIAKNKSESGASNGPHPKMYAALPDGWDMAQWGKPEDNGLPPGAFLLVFDDPSDPSTVRPASQEYETVRQRAMQGDDNAYAALRELGATGDLPPPQPSIWDWF